MCDSIFPLRRRKGFGDHKCGDLAQVQMIMRDSFNSVITSQKQLGACRLLIGLVKKINEVFTKVVPGRGRDGFVETAE